MGKFTTVRFHMGGFNFVKQGHNRREPGFIKHEEHIKENGEYIILKDQSLYDAYKEVFGEAIKEYNKKQKRKDRLIAGVEGYMEKIRNNKQGSKNKKTKDSGKQLAYEVIVGVGSMRPLKDHNGKIIFDDKGEIRRPYKLNESVCKNILLEYADDFIKNNKNLHVFGLYYHADEEGSPHLHIDFIPVAKGYKRGMQVQNSISKALKQEGFKAKSHKENCYTLWQERERAVLKDKLKERGIQIIRPDFGKSKVSEDWRVYKKKRKLEEDVAKLEKEKEELEVIDYLQQDQELFQMLINQKNTDTFGQDLQNIKDSLEEKGYGYYNRY